MQVRMLTAVLISAYLIVLCTEATVVRKCQGKQVIPPIIVHYVHYELWISQQQQQKREKEMIGVQKKKWQLPSGMIIRL